MGRSCLHTPIVTGYKRVPDPPAKIIPFHKLLPNYIINISITNLNKRAERIATKILKKDEKRTTFFPNSLKSQRK